MCVFICNIFSFFLEKIDVFISQKTVWVIGFVCVHIHQSHLCLFHVYLDLCCGECYYSCLLVVCAPIYVHVVLCVGEMFVEYVCYICG